MKLYVGGDDGTVRAIQSIEAGSDGMGSFVNIFVDGGCIELTRGEAELIVAQLSAVNW